MLIKKEENFMAILTSGGAMGADTCFNYWASQVGDTIYNVSFQGHKSACSHLVQLSDHQLNQANPFLEQACLKLQRRLPKEGYTKKLLQRNFFQIRKVDVVIAVAPLLTDQIVDGGTGWAIAMAQLLQKEIYVFDIKDALNPSWVCYNYDSQRFNSCDMPSKKERYAGIGSRKLPPKAEKEIKALFKFWHPQLIQ